MSGVLGVFLSYLRQVEKRTTTEDKSALHLDLALKERV